MTPNNHALQSILTLAPVVPVLVVEEVAHALPLARALVAGGLKALEITLRTPAALEVIRVIADEVEGAEVGAGTVLNPAQAEAAAKAGAKFLVSPGFSQAISKNAPVPLLPGVATATEAMMALDAGHSFVKLFPAEQVGGVGLLKALGSPLPQLKFCPTGGVSLANAPTYLALANVVCVGGSWVAPADAVRAGDFGSVTELARAAAQLRA